MEYNTLTELMTATCDAIREKEGSSEPITVQDIPQRISNIKSGAENLFDMITCLNKQVPSLSWHGLTFTILSDGGIRVNGTVASGYAWNRIVAIDMNIPNGFLSYGDYHVQGHCAACMFHFVIVYNDGTSKNLYNGDFTLDSSVKRVEISLLAGNTGATVSNVVIYPMLTKGKGEKPFKPY